MSRITLKENNSAISSIEKIYDGFSKRTTADRNVCPLDLAPAFIKLCQVESCGKCVPCRVGLEKMRGLFEKALDGEATSEDIDLIETTAGVVADSSDCAIGFEAGNLVLATMKAFKSDFKSHAETGNCVSDFKSVPCAYNCPANVDVPAYIALIEAGRYQDAVRVIRRDNPFPSVCGLVCEHPCEHHCRRNVVDDAINIRTLKRVAIDKAGKTPAHDVGAPTGKKVSIVGGGPCGLSAAYFLRMMGHEVTVYERRKKLGGMLRYGIPLYRLPDSYLDNDIDAILSMGVDVKMGVDIGKDITIKEIFDNSDAVFVTIGAHFDKKLRLENEDAEGVLSAVQLLGDMGDDNRPDFTGKTVVVVGGGNVAMDATRTSIRLGAKNVKCVYRRRILDMTALPEEIEGAIAEGADVVELMAPASVEVDAQGKAAALIGQPQMIGEVSRGRPMPVKANKPEVRIEADIIVVAIGQAINSKHFGDFDIPLQWDQLTADRTAAVPGKPGVFAGGDCVSGPSTVIKAIEAGKVAAGNIDEYLGFNNPIRLDVKIPHATHNYQRAAGRVNAMEREAEMRKHDFDLMELPISVEEEKQEARRCLRCDHFGLGAFRGGRVQQW